MRPKHTVTSRTYDWHFPLPRTHTGMLLGNAVLGAMVWGGENVLNLTLNRTGHWDHRGGKPWTAAMNYAAIRKLLEAGDEKGLRAAFEVVPAPPGQPPRPSVLPLGRLELHFAPGTRLLRGTLRLGAGEIVVRLNDPRGQERQLTLAVAAREPVLVVRFGPGLTPPAVKRVPAWEYVGEYLQSISFKEPAHFDSPRLAGWIQERPADEPIGVGYRLDGKGLLATVVYGASVEAAQARAARAVDRLARGGVEKLRRERLAWWKAYWAETPRVALPNERLEFIYYYGMYKFAGLTAPHGVAATLQGPWVEEYQLPPWSSDYHFNINVQMCYWPAYQGNHLEHLRPLFDLAWSWRETLRENARLFVGIPDGFLLPHATDDRGTCMGGFWTGTVDHGCTAWVAKMMYDYWRYGGDIKFLRTVAYPFMQGAMRVYEEMLERDGAKFVLPVSVSPEYRGAALNAWGRNASFQLAAIHALLEALQVAAGVLGQEPRPIWSAIQQGLPRACVQSPSPGDRARVVLWEGTDLEYSHRHHSHLAGFYPFDVLDLSDPAWREIATNTARWWCRQGMGQWTGWCIPWAAMLHARIGIPEMTEALLEYWERLFTNEGHGTLHDPLVWTKLRLPEQRPAARAAIPRGFGHGGEVMQIEAGMAACAAVLDLLVHVRRGVHQLFPGASPRWRHVAFSGIRTEGGFLVSAARQDGATTHISIHSDLGGALRLANPWPERSVFALTRRGRRELSGAVLELELARGEEVRLTPKG